jgi:hypothetical protein
MSEMFDTARGMIQNLAYMIEKYVHLNKTITNLVMVLCQMVVGCIIYYVHTRRCLLQWFTIIILLPVILIYFTNCCQH